MKAGESKSICLAATKPEGDEEVKFIEAPVKLSENCGGGCCIFELVKTDA